MVLNTNAVNNVSPISVDSNPQDYSEKLPLDVIPKILRNLAMELPELALVCRDWRKIVDSADFQDTIPNVNGPQRWTEFTKADAGKAPSLPRKFFKFLQTHIITYIPESVKIKNADGIELEVPIHSLQNIGKLFAHTINGRTISFEEYSWLPRFDKEISPEKEHWVLISKKAMGKRLNYTGQVYEAKDMGAIMSGTIDTVTSLFMEYLRTGEKLPLDENGKSIWIRVDDKIRRLWLKFEAYGFAVHKNSDETADVNLAFTPALKSFQCSAL
jgi:hypothetical protein